MKILKAQLNNVEEVLEIIQQAKDSLKAMNIDQWQAGYPNRDSIVCDINNNNAYVLIEDKVVGYMFLSLEREPAYNDSRCHWLNQDRYGIIHRLCVRNEYKGKGLSYSLFKFAEEFCLSNQVENLRIDTHIDNIIMQNALKKLNYKFCGLCQYNGVDRNCYQKLLK